MAGESNADVYASFGANPMIVTSGSVSAHEQNMLAQNVHVRDGDDSIELDGDVQDSFEQELEEHEQDMLGVNVAVRDGDDAIDLYDNTDKFATEADPDRMQVRVNGESGEATLDGEEVVTEGAQEGDGEGEDFYPLGETPSDLNDASEMLGQHEEGFQEMVNQAAERGLSDDAIVRIQEEYAGDGISEESYEELAKAGYSKAFVDSYIKGQEALVDSYVNQIKDFAGGADKFDQLITHMETNDAEAVEALYDAMGRRDIATVKALLNAAGQSRSKRFGKPAARTVTSRATPSKAESRKVAGFESQADMVKAMSDPRYRSDSAFRAEVERKVASSNFHW